MEKDLKNVGFSVSTYNALCRAGYTNLEELKGKTMKELFRIRNLGKKGVDEIVQVCSQHGIEIE